MKKISIITACYNSAPFIKDVFHAVASQYYGNIEHIIVDGGSTDGTRALIDQYRAANTRVVSEPDQGLYDAMNKGIACATGDIIGILNSDDWYATPNVLELVAQAFDDPALDVCYADLVYVDRAANNRVVRYWKSSDYQPGLFEKGWMPPHPTFFTRRQCYQNYGYYRLDLGTSADYELMLRYLRCHKMRAVYLPHLFVMMRTGGVSNMSLAKRLQAHCMDWKAWLVNGLIPYPWTLPCKPLRKLGQWRTAANIQVTQ